MEIRLSFTTAYSGRRSNQGELEINTGANHDISQPTPMGRINLPSEYPAHGVKVKTATSGGILHSAASTNRSNVFADWVARCVLGTNHFSAGQLGV